MRWSCAMSTHAELAVALAEAARDLEQALDGSPHLIAVFASPHHREHFARLHLEVRDRFGDVVVFGCAAGGVIAEHARERGAGLALLGGVLPGVELLPFHVSPTDLPEVDSSTSLWRRRLGLPDDDRTALLLLADPFSCDVPRLLAGADRALPKVTKVGGLASGAKRSGQHMLYAGRQSHATGAVGLAVRGDIRIDAVVSQGCRPIGNPMFVTRGEGNLVHALDGRRPAETLARLYEALGDDERELVHHELFVGVAIGRSREIYEPGEFLVRKILGIDGATGALAIDGPAGLHQVVQFHVRDARGCASDLERRLRDDAVRHPSPPTAALLFACRDRGAALYGSDDHDTKMLRRLRGDMPIAGFFCAGEIGPLGAETHLHNYASAVAMFRPAYRVSRKI